MTDQLCVRRKRPRPRHSSMAYSGALTVVPSSKRTRQRRWIQPAWPTTMPFAPCVTPSGRSCIATTRDPTSICDVRVSTPSLTYDTARACGNARAQGGDGALDGGGRETAVADHQCRLRGVLEPVA